MSTERMPRDQGSERPATGDGGRGGDLRCRRDERRPARNWGVDRPRRGHVLERERGESDHLAGTRGRPQTRSNGAIKLALALT